MADDGSLQAARGNETAASREVSERWMQPGSGQHYEAGRWRNARARGRDERLLQALCARHRVTFSGPWLDVACGTGRLSKGLFESSAYHGIDMALPMLREHPRRGHIARASALALPFRDGAFEFVLACRLLHHFAVPADRQAALSELARVSSGYVAVTFWDAASWPGLRRAGGGRGSDRRRPLARSTLKRELAQVGCELIGMRTSVRWLAMQTWALARSATT